MAIVNGSQGEDGARSKSHEGCVPEETMDAKKPDVSTLSVVGKPLLRGHFHQAMFFVALGALASQLWTRWGRPGFWSFAVYSSCAVFMFGVSALYHRINWRPAWRRLLRKIDHAAIYLMIAGSFTPLCVFSLSASSSHRVLWTVWLIAVLGICQSVFFVDLPKMVTALLYLVAGYQILPYLGELRASMGTPDMVLLLAGGLAYSLGALCYGLKRPRLFPRVFSYHEVFHVLVNVGATLHFVAISRVTG